MSVSKTQFYKALSVIKSDNCNIPFPQVLSTGTNTSVTASALVNTSGDFVNLGVQIGDIVYNTTDGTAATVTAVVSATQLTLNANIFTATSKSYTIYQANSLSGYSNGGCCLYVGGGGTVVVTTLGGDVVTFAAVPTGTILPVQVVKLASASTATSVIALW